MTDDVHANSASLFSMVSGINGNSDVTFSNVVSASGGKDKETIYEELNWPEWVKDRPSSRQTISVKNPICSIFAEGDSETQVENILYKRLEEIELFVKSI